MTDLQEIIAVWRGETSRATRSGRVVVLLVLFMMFVGLALSVVGFFNRQINLQVEKQATKAGVDLNQAKDSLGDGKKQFLSVFITDDEQMLDSLLVLPLVLLVVFKLTLRFVPLFVALMGFDQLAGEIGPKSIRFLVVRLKRNNLILGKFVSQVTIFSALLFVCTLLMVIVARLLNPDFEAKDMALWTLRLLVSSFVLALAYLALTTLCSAVVRTGAVSLVLNIIVLFAIWFVALIGEWYRFPGEASPDGLLAQIKDEHPLAYLRYASVWHYGQDLLHPDWARFLTAAVMHVGFALLFLGLAQLALKERDL